MVYAARRHCCGAARVFNCHHPPGSTACAGCTGFTTFCCSRSSQVMRKVAAFLLLAVVPLVADATTPLLYSPSAIVYGVDQQQTLLEKNPDAVRPLASLTKLMVAMVVLDQALDLDETLTVNGADVDRLKHTSSRIPLGAALERREMLRLALMASENRSASALSRSGDGGQPAFIQRMNEKARELGMTHTHFDDPTGLSAQNVSTARDVLKMADAASHYPLVREFSTLTHYAEDVGTRTLLYRNSDPLVGRPGWAIRVSKTGFTNEAGRCIVVEANMANGPVIIALLGAGSSGARSADLTAIRNWLAGSETPVATPLLYYTSASIHHHKPRAMPRNSSMRLIAYSAKATAKVHGVSHNGRVWRRHHGYVTSVPRRSYKQSGLQ